MKISINTFGTRGDIQPYIALGLGLQQAGHSVRIVTHQIFESFVRAYDLDFYPLALDPRQVLIDQNLTELGNNTLRITRWLKENFRPVLREIFEATLAANQQAVDAELRPVFRRLACGQEASHSVYGSFTLADDAFPSPVWRHRQNAADLATVPGRSQLLHDKTIQSAYLQSIVALSQ